MSMPALDWTFVNGRIESYVKRYNLEKKSRAFTFLLLERLFDLDEDAIKESITDGGNDCGIDAVYISRQIDEIEINVFQSKYHETSAGVRKSFPANECSKILGFLDLTLSDDVDLRKHMNNRLFEKANEIRDIFKEARNVPNINIWFCSNGLNLNSGDRAQFLDRLAKYAFISLKEIDLETVSSLATVNRGRKANSKVFKILDNSIFERSDGDIRGIVATIDAVTLVDIIRDEKDSTKVDRSLFDDNIRVYLGKDNEVNSMIFQSIISESNARFWYLNNGVTMICSSLSYPKHIRNPPVKVSDLQVVNGAQTCNAIFEAYREHPEIVSRASILIKLFETREDGIANNIAISTNSQTRIYKRDMMSNDIIQRRLQESLRDFDIWYERRRHEHDIQTNVEKLDALKAGQIILAFYMGAPDKSKRESDKIFGPYYEEVFSRMRTAFEIAFAFRIFQKIEYLREVIEEDLRSKRLQMPTDDFLLYGTFHVLYVVGVIIDRDHLPREIGYDYESQIREAVEIIGRVVRQQKKQAYYNFFRDPRNVERLNAEASQKQMNLF